MLPISNYDTWEHKVKVGKKKKCLLQLRNASKSCVIGRRHVEHLTIFYRSFLWLLYAFVYMRPDFKCHMIQWNKQYSTTNWFGWFRTRPVGRGETGRWSEITSPGICGDCWGETELQICDELLRHGRTYAVLLRPEDLQKQLFHLPSDIWEVRFPWKIYLSLDIAEILMRIVDSMLLLEYIWKI